MQSKTFTRADQAPRVGVAVFVCKDERFLMGFRKSSHGHGTWSLPGGHLEYAESFERAAEREVREETSITIKNVRIGAVTNDFFEESGRHYVTVWAVADYLSGTATTLEPEKYVNPTWVSASEVPGPLFEPWERLLKVTSVEEILRAPLVAAADLGR
ncbi:nucleotide triphosphate diphosphatase NUDT15 [Winogradskya humida]|uniref:MutT/nudix family protein n=1 Tax=Winogradskya humida TaxID=113566 RepID=A0ABQ4A368_9ACTN|nr:NUDIX domain-containing protein [Actinoplanes humidus]GIE25279.1 putative MutT/nudix family protein [Actinoplanes humidus]